jgi:NAD(P)H-hydrate repair Nnr-like enzyme with NAD(P)H-hydrate dehydratase domain
MGDALTAGACAAWTHGRAAELAEEEQHRHGARGITLADVEHALARAWSAAASDPAPRYPVLAELPAVGDPA